MRQCPYCGVYNQDYATNCSQCHSSLASSAGTLYTPKSYWIGPEKARVVRDKALSIIVLGLLVKVYWGGYGPWPVIDNPTLANLRTWLEPLLLYGGAAVYVVGWVLRYI